MNEKKVERKRREAELWEEKEHLLAYAWHFTYIISFKFHNDPIRLVLLSLFLRNEMIEAKRH